MSSGFRVDGDAYDDYMGRYAIALAGPFADFARVASGMRVVDVGAGTGALTGELLARGATVAAVDPSPEFAAVLRARFPAVEIHEAPAETLPFADDAFDIALAQLVVAFVNDAPASVAEMARVARRVALCMWGVDEVEMFAAVERTAEVVGAPSTIEPRRYRSAPELRDLVAPLGEVESAELDVSAGYADFDEFWNALDRGVGPLGQWVVSLEAGARERVREELFRQVGSPSGRFELGARAFAVAVTPR